MIQKPISRCSFLLPGGGGSRHSFSFDVSPKSVSGSRKLKPKQPILLTNSGLRSGWIDPVSKSPRSPTRTRLCNAGAYSNAPVSHSETANLPRHSVRHFTLTAACRVVERSAADFFPICCFDNENISRKGSTKCQSGLTLRARSGVAGSLRL